MEIAEHHYLLLDASKLHRRSLLSFASTDDFDAVFCDANQESDASLPQNFRLV